ncbi:rhodanese-like domain-containing protein [Thalassotalea marina]|uniref:Rhodanese n=1 Tax=Thalassotalea marina TaxID=1673741 RepID=A0A919ELL3_9GAMM|nr:rhodanese-like domain-containing protein [Thalassotalea marina]GHG00085.1 rhodanese [Thalassotalea marina]
MSNVNKYPNISTEITADFFSKKLACETDCSDVYADIKAGCKHFVLVDTRSPEAYAKSHAITAINIPNSQLNTQTLQPFSKDTLFVVYCWGPGCNGASKAALKLASMGYQVKEMLGGIHYWEDFERYPVNRRVNQAQQ